ncbi:MAG: c-type cytochrome [Flavobacteriales bacterium]|jgi:hypothetical protein|nr:c-type cytochrome [Flavobacteriales bacterium]MBK6550752.1 c-type cytochrome [Flavobacteriales bacterium]MBK6883238.1 c-type cytochrome [Flavobacteriales bacterium]MBK7103419.1 c-type cytochrome [Flavobacteriales bacterium]MBK7112757.1 c-type cytochrome [Flavobacteriales bacterium]
MKKLLRILGVLVLLVLVVIGGAITYVTQALPNIEAPTDLKVEITPERVTRGEYLANSVCVCMDCHSARDWNAYAGPPKPGTAGGGGDKFDRTMEFPGEFYAKNITPFALAKWSDGEVYRAITSGVSKDGHPFFPVMPYLNYNKLATEDVYSIIAYLRSLPSVETAEYPESEIDFPVNVIMHTVPQPAHPTQRPEWGDPTYGEYLANAAACVECHTRAEKGKKIGEPFAGGFAFAFPNGAVLRSSNITPSEDGGIGGWSKEEFIQRFKQYTDSGYVVPAIDWERGDMQTVMPWMMYANMTEQDLGAIYDYLRTIPAAPGVIEKWTPPGS